MDIKDKFLNIISLVKKTEIENLDDSIFSYKYELTPNEIAYILLLASEKIGFTITEELIDSLETQNSFSDIINYISLLV